MRPAYLQIRQSGPETFEAFFKVPAQGDLRLGIHARFPEGCAVRTPVTSYHTGDAFIERWTVSCPGGLVGKTIVIDGLPSTLIDVLVRIERSDGTTQVVRLTPGRPSFDVEAEPGRLEVSRTYFSLGFEHILLGLDHLLFVLGLIFIVRGRRMVLWTITSFTLAHSITLAVATLGYAHAPVPPLNAAIALSILFLGPEIVRVQRGESSLASARPWLVAFSFGLLHGFGFASGLASIGLPQADVPLALLCFNLGVEAGQLTFVALVFRLALSFRQLEIAWPRWVQRAPAYCVGGLGAFWTIQRVAMMVGA